MEKKENNSQTVVFSKVWDDLKARFKLSYLCRKAGSHRQHFTDRARESSAITPSERDALLYALDEIVIEVHALRKELKKCVEK